MLACHPQGKILFELMLIVVWLLLILPVSAKATVALSANKCMLSKLNSTGYWVVPNGVVISIVPVYKLASVSSLRFGVAVMAVIPSAKFLSTLNQGTEVAKVRLSAFELRLIVFAAMLCTPKVSSKVSACQISSETLISAWAKFVVAGSPLDNLRVVPYRSGLILSALTISI